MKTLKFSIIYTAEEDTPKEGQLSLDVEGKALDLVTLLVNVMKDNEDVANLILASADFHSEFSKIKV